MSLKKLFNSNNFSISSQARNTQIPLIEKPQLKILRFKSKTCNYNSQFLRYSFCMDGGGGGHRENKLPSFRVKQALSSPNFKGGGCTLLPPPPQPFLKKK